MSFNEGMHTGVGRISLGTKALLYVGRGPFLLATSCDLYLPSPNEEQFSGSDSAAILPRVIGSARLRNWMRLHINAGYDYDFDVSQLRRFLHQGGVNVASPSRRKALPVSVSRAQALILSFLREPGRRSAANDAAQPANS